VTDSVPNPGTTTTVRGSQGNATVTDPYRGSYTGLARNHSTGEWSLVSGIETKPTSDIPWSLPSTVTNTLNIADLKTTGDVRISGGDLVSTTTSFNALDTTVTDLNFARTATTINMGSGSGTLTIGNPTVVGTQTTQNLWNTVATTINIGNAATTVNGWNAVTTLNLGNTTTAAQTVNMFGASTGSSTYNVATGTTASAATKTINIGSNAASGSTLNVNVGDSAVGASTFNIGNGATVSGSTKTVNIGTSGVSGSTTNVTIGAASATSTGTVAVHANTVTLTGGTTVQVSQDPTAGVDLAVATKRYVEQRPTIISTSQTLVARGNLRTSGVQSSGNYFVIPGSGLTLTLPASPVLGDEVVITDIAGTAFNTPVNIARNGQLIQGLAEDMPFNINGASVRLVYSNTTYGWRIIA